VRVCPDTNCWLEKLVTPAEHTNLLLATVVLQELWAGAPTPAERGYLERLYLLARRGRRLLNPPPAAWILSGQALRILAQTHRVGSTRLRALRNDVLLAATALLHGAAVMTRNRDDFAVIAAVLPVRVVAPPV
jgi:predicted nucleic acid-binding protein